MTPGLKDIARINPNRSSWYQETIEYYVNRNERLEAAGEPTPNMEPFKLGKATQKQQDAIRGLAEMLGYKDLRGFWRYLENAEMTYYDLIKIASPE